MNNLRNSRITTNGPDHNQADARPNRGLLVLVPVFIILVGLISVAAGSDRMQALGSTQPAVEVVKVAFLGDARIFGSDGQISPDPIAVLQLIKDQNTDFVLHQGDFAYGNEDKASARAWNEQVNLLLGADYPYFGSVGNHDTEAWSTYQEMFQDRLNLNPDAVCQGDYGIKSSCHYKGIFFILSGVGTMGLGSADHVQYIEDQLAQDDSTWRICTWHKNQRNMQVGEKPDDVGWGAYETCREAGAIIATAHEHSYHRTKTMISLENQVVDPDWSVPDHVRVTPGSTFVFVSGLGGAVIRDQKRCEPTTYPYGCKKEWASIYTLDQGAKHGALFIEFNYGGDPNKARGQFINVDGVVIDEFMITAGGENTAPVGENQQVTTPQGTAREITLTASDADGDPLTYEVFDGPVSGVLSGDAPNLTYTPNPDFVGSDNFTFKVNDTKAESGPTTVSITVSPIRADIGFGLLQDPEDRAAGLGLAITRVSDPITDTEVATAWGGYQAKLRYDGTCVNILDIRPKEFSVDILEIDNVAGVTGFQGKATPGTAGPSVLTHVITRIIGGSPVPCPIAIELIELTDDGGSSVGVIPPSLIQNVLRGDALADEIINIADAMYIAQYLAGLRPECTGEGDASCLHSLNAASWRHDGEFDLVTIGDAWFIAQHLLGLTDVL